MSTQPEAVTTVTPHPHPAAPALPDVPPRALHGELPDQPVDGAGEPDGHRHARWRSGRRSTTPTSRSATTWSSSTRSRVCPTWSTRPTAASCSTASPTARSSASRSAGPRAPPSWSGSRDNGFEVAEPVEVNEGEGDFLLVGDTHPRRHRASARAGRQPPRAAREVFGKRGRRLNLVDPRFYHLDTAIAVLDPVEGPGGVDHANIAYLPQRVRRATRRASSRERFPDAILVADDDGASLRPQLARATACNVIISAARDRLRGAAARARLQPACSSTSPSCSSGGGGDQVLHPRAAGPAMSRTRHDRPDVIIEDGRRQRGCEEHVAHNYHPLPVVVVRGEGAWVTDVEGKRYLDLLAALLRPQLRAPASRLIVAAHGAARARLTLHQPRVPQRPPRAAFAGGASPSCAARISCCR